MALATAARAVASQQLKSHPDVAVAAAAAAAEIVAANPARVTLWLSNVGANPARIGDASAGAAQGFQLAAGATLPLDSTDAVYAYSASGTTLALVETYRP